MSEWFRGTELPIFAKKLRETLQSRGMTKRDFARKMGVTENTVWSWTKGHTQPNPQRISKIASILEVTEAFLRTGLDAEETEGIADSNTIGSAIEQLKQKIAGALGMHPIQVKISFEFL